VTDTVRTEGGSGDSEILESALEFSLDRIDEKLDPFEDACPVETETGLRYESTADFSDWTAGFWPGLLWSAYERTGADRYRQVAEWLLPSFAEQLYEGAPDDNNHDLGFIYTHAALAHDDVTGRQRAFDVAVEAADQLATRFHSGPEVIQAWGDHRLNDDEVRIIVDTMMNLPLLYRIADLTGRERLREIAAEHAHRTADTIVRDDGSTAHTYYFDVGTGEPLREQTHQGYDDDSTWSRGQAWAVYGFPLSYHHTGQDRFLATARDVAEYFLDELPADHVPPWDFDADEDIRDTSAAAIGACGLQQLAAALPAGSDDRHRYEDAAVTILESLATNYTTEGTDSDAVLSDGAAYRPGDRYEQPLIYGDFFFLSGLCRATSDWTPYVAR
jgi:unsaturated chondroitin disaccharide hydrolase